MYYSEFIFIPINYGWITNWCNSSPKFVISPLSFVNNNNNNCKNMLITIRISMGLKSGRQTKTWTFEQLSNRKCMLGFHRHSILLLFFFICKFVCVCVCVCVNGKVLCRISNICSLFVKRISFVYFDLVSIPFPC